MAAEWFCDAVSSLSAPFLLTLPCKILSKWEKKYFLLHESSMLPSGQHNKVFNQCWNYPPLSCQSALENCLFHRFHTFLCLTFIESIKIRKCVFKTTLSTYTIPFYFYWYKMLLNKTGLLVRYTLITLWTFRRGAALFVSFEGTWVVSQT